MNKLIHLPKKQIPSKYSFVKPKLKLVLAVALTIIALDHLTKWLIVENISFGGSITIIPNIFDIVHTRNTGAAFGMLSGWESPLRDSFFYAIGVVAFFFLYHYIKSTHESDKITIIALSLICGGALGNLSDRLLRGSVVDFLSFHYYNVVKTFSLFGHDFVIPLTWPAFNVADSSICVGVGLLLIQNFRTPLASTKS